MSPSSTPNSSTFTTPVSTPPPEQTSPSKDLGILDYNGKKYKVTVIYTDETGKAVNGPEGIDQEKVHKLTKELLDEIPDIEQSAKITIDENCVTGGEAAIPHNPKTKEIWNNLYTELIKTKEKKPSNDTSGLSTKVILEALPESTPAEKLQQFKERIENPIAELFKAWYLKKNPLSNVAKVLSNINNQEPNHLSRGTAKCDIKLAEELLEEFFKTTDIQAITPSECQLRKTLKKALEANIALDNNDIAILKWMFENKKTITEQTENQSSDSESEILIEEPKSEAAEPASNKTEGVLVDLPLTEEGSINLYFKENKISGELQSLLDKCSRTIGDRTAYKDAERLADAVKTDGIAKYAKYTEDQKNLVLAYIKSATTQ